MRRIADSLTILALAALLLASAPPAIHAKEQNVSPGINRHYQGAEYRQWLSTFEYPGREVYARRHDVLRALQLKPGMDIADVGAGTGFYSLMFATRVAPQGKVYAVDVTEDFIRNIDRRAAENKLGNIVTVLSSQNDTRLEPGSVDMAFVCNTYHHFEYPQTMLASMRNALRPGGALVVIDYRKQPGVSTAWVMSHVRADKKRTIEEIEKAGFKLVEDSNLLKENFFLRFVKTGIN